MKLSLLTALLLTGLCFSAHAGPEIPNAKTMKGMSVQPVSDAGFYVAVEGGSQFSTHYGDQKQTLDGSPFGSVVVKNELHSGWGGVGGLKAGYNFASFAMPGIDGLRLQPAVEAEALYIGDDTHANGFVSSASTQHFSSNSGAFFLNGILRFKNPSIVTPYIGAGPGLQYITTHGEINVSAPLFFTGPITGLNTSDLDFAGQALFGLDIAVCPHVTIFSEYKFIDAIGTDGKNSNSTVVFGGGTYRLKPDQIQQDLITAGVKYEF